MRLLRVLLLTTVPVAALGACTMPLNDQDRALLTSASENAQQAKDLAQQALAAAQAAQASADNAMKDAQAGSEKADIVARQAQRKSSP